MMLYYKLLYYIWLKKKIKKKKTFFLVGTPLHENIGDAAIAFAEQIFLKYCLPDNVNIIEINQNQMIEYLDVLKLIIKPDSTILFHGGGNMGDEWIKEEIDRRKVMNSFSKNRMIILPQTIYYKNKEKFDESVNFYSQFKNLIIVAREKTSFEIIKKNYMNEILLTPDIVFFLKNKINPKLSKVRKGCLLCYRNDNEISMSKQVKDGIEIELNKQGIDYSYTDMINQCQIMPNMREDIIYQKLLEFSGARLVITDRLHGMIFCYLTNTPCLVFGNYNHKVFGTYEWIKDTNYIKFGEIKNLEKQILGLLNIKDYKQGEIINSDVYNELEMRIIQKW